MGGCSSCASGSKHRDRVSKKKADVTLMIIGLDNAGKTTVMSVLQKDKDLYIAPTIGFSRPLSLNHNGTQVRVFDVGGGPRIRGVWTNYYADVHGIVYVVDAANKEDLATAKQVFHEAISHEKVAGKPVLVLGNKQDLPGALPESDISMQLGLGDISCRHSVVKCIANFEKNGGEFDKAVYEGFDWLMNAVRSEFDSLNARVLRDVQAAELVRAERKKAKKAMYEEVAKRKEAEAAAKKAAEDAAAASETKANDSSKVANNDPDVILCATCNTRAATGRAAVSKWMAVCDECKAWLMEVKAAEAAQKPPPPGPPGLEGAGTGAGAAEADANAGAGAGAGAGAANNDDNSNSSQAEPQPPEEAPSAAATAAAAAADPDVILCSVCNKEPAVRKSGKLNWQPVCDGCDPATSEAAGAAAEDAAAAGAGAGAAAEAAAETAAPPKPHESALIDAEDESTAKTMTPASEAGSAASGAVAQRRVTLPGGIEVDETVMTPTREGLVSDTTGKAADGSNI